jgi:hypothetical protein
LAGHNEELYNFTLPRILLRRVYLNKGVEMGGRPSNHGRDKKCIHNFSLKISKKEAAWKAMA